MSNAAWRVIGLLALASPALAAPPKITPPPPPKVFLSPSGEPFRPTQAQPDPLKAWFDQADIKHQGYLDREAFRADAARFFKKLDENGDGIIDGFEVSDYEHKLAPELTAEAEGPAPVAAGGGRGGGAGGGRGRNEPIRLAGPPSGAPAADQHARKPGQRAIQQLIGEPEPVSGADFNFDSHITLDEWMRATDQRFQILDQKKDGKLTLDELKARFKPQAP